MNNSNDRAKTFAQIEAAHDLIDRANEQAYNWIPLVEYITRDDYPEKIASSLKTIYYEFVDHIIRSNEFCGGDEATANALYSLRSIIESLEEMQGKGTRMLAFKPLLSPKNQ